MANTDVKQQIVDKIKDSNNILVTVSSSPSVDELSAALGITLFLNKLDKHATAVFSGSIPSAIEFLNPENTFESTVDSLRDFIIALDKEKADHLRYKVDGDVVKIFITPYRTTISQDDLDFSQGDYNVEAVLAIGVKTEQDLDQALSSHGRILHDATVASLSLDGAGAELGAIQWIDREASGYAEMLYTLAQAFKAEKNSIDEQIANAFLTGIVAATDRFSNGRTTSTVMTAAAELMSKGADQQLIASKLHEERAISDVARADNEQDASPAQSSEENSSDTPLKIEQNESKVDAAGGLSIEHDEKKDLDQVTEQVQAKNAADATEVAEQQLAEQLEKTTASPVAPAPSLEDLQQGAISDTGNIDSPKQPEMVELQLPPVETQSPSDNQSLRGPVSIDKWKSFQDASADEPVLGGTLNATTEQAAADKMREALDDRNRTILSHDGTSYATDAPSFQAPMNASSVDMSEPEVRDVFAEQTNVTSHANMIQPSTPSLTLEDIDRQNRAATPEADSLQAIHAALESAQSQPDAPANVVPTPQPQEPGLGVLPPLPPMPDFSTLPPLPGSPSNGLVDPVTVNPLGSILPPTPVSAQTPAAPDPAQFKIPGQ